MKICILESSYEQSNSPLSSVDPYRDVEHYFQNEEYNHSFKRVLIEKAQAAQQIRELAVEGHDVFINLCDGASDEDRAGLEVVQLLEKYHLPYTGANPTFYEPSKELQKMMAYYYDVPTPKFNFAFSEEDIAETERHLKFPMIVKHYNGYCSVGMSKKSKVTNSEELFEMARATIREFRGALIEEFIEGRELTVLVAENPDDQSNPIAYQPVECLFLNGETFKHFDVKHCDLDSVRWVKCEDQILSEKVKEMSKKMFIALRGVGFGRVDYRVNSKGDIYFLEMNPNCGVYYKAPEDNPNSLGSADFILMHDIGHVKFTEHIIKCAFYQAKKRLKPCVVKYKPETGYGLFARCDIKEGEIVYELEGKPHNLITKTYVEEEWNELQKKWFGEYAYPISANVWAIWNDDPMQWLPINHSCDPNTWVKGLNLIALRDIPKGEHITIEYATYNTEAMAEFNCNCQAVDCRKLIKETDYTLPFMKKYENHITDYVLLRMKEHKLRHAISNGV